MRVKLRNTNKHYFQLLRFGKRIEMNKKSVEEEKRAKRNDSKCEKEKYNGNKFMKNYLLFKILSKNFFYSLSFFYYYVSEQNIYLYLCCTNYRLQRHIISWKFFNEVEIFNKKNVYQLSRAK